VTVLRFDCRCAHIEWLQPVWIDRREIIGVNVLRRRVGGVLRFVSPQETFAGVLFWTPRPKAVAAALRARGWPIE